MEQLTSLLFPFAALGFILLLVVMLFGLLGSFASYIQSQYAHQSDSSYFRVLFDIGARGEYFTGKVAEKALPGARLFFNVYLPSKTGYSELDIVAVHGSGLYVFESKNYSGWIFGRSSDRYWTQSLNRRTKYRFLNPLLQNKGHLLSLARATGISSELIKPVVVFSERCELKSLSLAKHDVVLKRSSLGEWLTRESSSTILDDVTQARIIRYLESCVGKSNAFKLEHIKSVHNKHRK